MTAEDPLEWPVLLTGGWTANVFLYFLVALAYYRPLRLGATLLLTVGVVLAAWLVLVVALSIGVKRYRRTANEMIVQKEALARTLKGASHVR